MSEGDDRLERGHGTSVPDVDAFDYNDANTH